MGSHRGTGASGLHRAWTGLGLVGEGGSLPGKRASRERAGSLVAASRPQHPSASLSLGVLCRRGLARAGIDRGSASAPGRHARIAPWGRPVANVGPTPAQDAKGCVADPDPRIVPGNPRGGREREQPRLRGEGATRTRSYLRPRGRVPRLQGRPKEVPPEAIPGRASLDVRPPAGCAR